MFPHKVIMFPYNIIVLSHNSLADKNTKYAIRFSIWIIWYE